MDWCRCDATNKEIAEPGIFVLFYLDSCLAVPWFKHAQPLPSPARMPFDLQVLLLFLVYWAPCATPVLTDLSFLLQKHCWGSCQQRPSHSDQIPAGWWPEILTLWWAAGRRGQVSWELTKHTETDSTTFFCVTLCFCLSLSRIDWKYYADRAWIISVRIFFSGKQERHWLNTGLCSCVPHHR